MNKILFLKRTFSLMSNEDLLIAVDINDNTLGPVGKFFAHQKNALKKKNYDKNILINSKLFSSKKNIQDPPILHRAFSIFHFSHDNQLLLTQRSALKATFPLYWSNTCCSHPMWNIIEERGSTNGRADQLTLDALKIALVRRMKEELLLNMNPENFTFITRLVYLAETNNQYAEFEMDYIFTSIIKDIKGNQKDLMPNPEEICDTQWLDKKSLESKINTIKFTPWSLYLLKQFILPQWDLLSKGKIINNKIQEKIYHAGDLTNYK